MNNKEKCAEALQYIADTITKMTGASVGEIRSMDKCIVYLAEFINSLELPPEPQKKSNDAKVKPIGSKKFKSTVNVNQAVS